MKYVTTADAHRDHPPRKPHESAYLFLKRTLIQHRSTHQKWVDYMRSGGRGRDIGSIDYEKAAIDRYDSCLFALDQLAKRDGI